MLDSLRDNHREFLATLFAIAVIGSAWLEAFFPRRPVFVPRLRRWISNLSLGAFNTAFFALAVPVGAFAAAMLAEQHGWGVLRLAQLPAWLALPIGVLAIDAVVYFSHRVFHAVPALWRLHHVHHSDIDLDFTTTVRHHPLEALLIVFVLFGATIAVGVSPESVVLHQFAATAFDFMNHANIRIPQRLDSWIRWIFVTPAMHLVHHSALKRETDSNYGTVLSIWDRLCGTYVAKPAAGITGMMIGLEYRREPPDQRLDRLVVSPFARTLSANLGRHSAAAVSPDEPRPEGA